MSTNPFAPAVKCSTQLKAMIFGPTGSGKTYGALTLARGLVGPTGRIALINTEPRGTQWQIGKHQFDEKNLDRDKGFTPDMLTSLILDAEAAGYGAVVVDSITDFYEGPGGLLEIKQKLDKENSRMAFANWQTITKLCNKINETVIYGCGLHVIYTAFAREKLKQDAATREIIHLGIRPRVREHLYEKLDVAILLDEAHNATFDKNRIGAPEFDGPITVEKAAKLREYLTGETVQKAKAAAGSTQEIHVVARSVKVREQEGDTVVYGDNEVVLLVGCAGIDKGLELVAQVVDTKKTQKYGNRDLPVYRSEKWKVDQEELTNDPE